jgi:hypothetical protein
MNYELLNSKYAKDETKSIIDYILEFLIDTMDYTTDIKTIMKMFFKKLEEDPILENKKSEFPYINDAYLELFTYLYNFVMFKKTAKKVGHLNINFNPISTDDVKYYYGQIIHEKKSIKKSSLIENNIIINKNEIRNVINEIFGFYDTKNAILIIGKILSYFKNWNNPITNHIQETIYDILKEYLKEEDIEILKNKFIPFKTYEKDVLQYITRVKNSFHINTF